MTAPTGGDAPLDSPLDATRLAERLHAARLTSFLTGEPGVEGSEFDTITMLLVKAASVYTAAINTETRKDYARRWRMFEAWCAERGLPSLPAAPETVMVYLADSIGPDGASLSTLRGWSAAIARVHLEAGHAPPSEDPGMTTFLRGLSRLNPPRARRENVQALRIGPLREVCRAIDSGAVNAAALRDRAILGLYSCGIGDGEMTRLQWEQVRFTAKQAHLTLLRFGRRPGRTVTLRSRDGDPGCPVASLRDWRDVAGGSDVYGPVFVLVEGGQFAGGPLKDKRLFLIRKSRLEAFGVDEERASVSQAMALLVMQPAIDVRDRAALLVGFAGAFRRIEVMGLRWADLQFSDAGVVVHLRRSKTDLSGHGRDVGIPYGKSALTCPVTALSAWHDRVAKQLGQPGPEDFVFVHVGRSGRITRKPLSTDALTRMVSTRAAAAGLDGKWGGRSLRAGFISTAADLEIPLEAIAAQSRHATLDSLILYVRRQDPFRRNPAGDVGL